MIRRLLGGLAIVVLLIGTPTTALATPEEDVCTVPILGYHAC